MEKQIIGIVLSLSNTKTKCSHCNRQHGLSFIVQDGTERKKYGSGCILKQGFNNLELSKAIAKARRNINYLADSLTIDILSKVVDDEV